LVSRFDINGVATFSDADGLLKTLKHAACFGELVRDPALILLDRPDRAARTGPTQFPHDLRRRACQRVERAQQAGVLVSPFFVFGWKHPGNPKRVGDGPTVRRKRIDHPKRELPLRVEGGQSLSGDILCPDFMLVDIQCMISSLGKARPLGPSILYNSARCW